MRTNEQHNLWNGFHEENSQEEGQEKGELIVEKGHNKREENIVADGEQQAKDWTEKD